MSVPEVENTELSGQGCSPQPSAPSGFVLGSPAALLTVSLEHSSTQQSMAAGVRVSSGGRSCGFYSKQSLSNEEMREYFREPNLL